LTCSLIQPGHKPGKPRILREFPKPEKLWEFCATLDNGKIVTNKIESPNAVSRMQKILENALMAEAKPWTLMGSLQYSPRLQSL